MAFSQILSCSKTFTFINPSSPGSTFSVTPARAQTVKGRIEASVQSYSIALPAWLTAADKYGNPAEPQLARAVSEGSVTVG